MLKNTLRRIAPEAEVVLVNTPADLAPYATGAVLLVNRVLDGVFPNDSGLDLIQAHLSDEGASPALLISNYADAQAAAEAAGAMPGFGKSDLESAATAERIQAALAHVVSA